MTVWRPSDDIRVKVIGLAWQHGRLLAVEVETDDGRIKGVRPPGGSVQFGEARGTALRREFLEELKTEIRITGPWHAFENIFEHEGRIGHEIVFAADIELADASLYQRAEILFEEDDGTPCRARWFEPSTLPAAGLDLYPAGLAGFVSGRD